MMALGMSSLTVMRRTTAYVVYSSFMTLDFVADGICLLYSR